MPENKNMPKIPMVREKSQAYLNFALLERTQLTKIQKVEGRVKNAARTKDLGCHLAKILNQLQSKKLNCSEDEAGQIRLDATQKVLQENLNETDTRKMVSEIIQEHSKSKKNNVDISRTLEVYQATRDNLNKLRINQLKPRQLKSLKRIMAQKLAAIESKLDSFGT